MRTQAAELGSLGSLMSVPVGGQIAGPYSALPVVPGAVFDWADGGLIDRSTYAAFYAAQGGSAHVYNGGVDPGSNKVRKPDKRGRVAIGADNFGQGAAGRLTVFNRALGQNGGEERHQNTVSELANHSHQIPMFSANAGHGYFASYVQASDGWTGIGSLSPTQGADFPHNNLQPYEIDTIIVRIA